MRSRSFLIFLASIVIGCSGKAATTGTGAPLCAPSYGPSWAFDVNGCGSASAVEPNGQVAIAAKGCALTDIGIDIFIRSPSGALGSQTSLASALGVSAIEAAQDGGLFVTGPGNMNNPTPYVARLDANDTLAWYQTLSPTHSPSGDYSPLLDYLLMAPSSNGGLWVAGIGQRLFGPNEHGNIETSQAPFLARFDQDGNVLWQEMLPAPPGDAQAASFYGGAGGLVVTADGHAIVAIRTMEGSILETFDADGAALASITLPIGLESSIASLVIGQEGNVYAAGTEVTRIHDPATNQDTVTSAVIVVSVDPGLQGVRWKQSYPQGRPLLAPRPCGGLILAGALTDEVGNPQNALFLELDDGGNEQRRLSLSAAPTERVFSLDIAAHGADGVVFLGQYTGGDLTVGPTHLSGGGKFIARLSE